MRSTENTLGRLPTGTAVLAPKSVSTTPAVVAPHPPLAGGPGSYAVPLPTSKTPGAALLWTLFLGPLGLCYLSATAGLATTLLTVAAVVVSGSGLVLAVIWPVAMLLALLHTTGNH